MPARPERRSSGFESGADVRIEVYQGGALHDRLLLALLGGQRQLWEVHKHLSHFVPPLAAAHVHNALAVAVLGQCLRDDGLAAAKGSWNGAGACM